MARRPGNPNIAAAGKKTQIKKGEVRNPKGKQEGVKNWSTVVQQLLADEDFANKVISKKPSWWTNLPNKNLANIIASAMLIKAAGGDDKAAKWVRETGFGNKVTHDFDQSILTPGAQVTIRVVKAKEIEIDETPTTEPDPEPKAT
jgi:hypothetical protein